MDLDSVYAAAAHTAELLGSAAAAAAEPAAAAPPVAHGPAAAPGPSSPADEGPGGAATQAAGPAVGSPATSNPAAGASGEVSSLEALLPHIDSMAPAELLEWTSSTMGMIEGSVAAGSSDGNAVAAVAARTWLVAVRRLLGLHTGLHQELGSCRAAVQRLEALVAGMTSAAGEVEVSRRAYPLAPLRVPGNRARLAGGSRRCAPVCLAARCSLLNAPLSASLPCTHRATSRTPRRSTPSSWLPPSSSCSKHG